MEKKDTDLFYFLEEGFFVCLITLIIEPTKLKIKTVDHVESSRLMKQLKQQGSINLSARPQPFHGLRFRHTLVTTTSFRFTSTT